ncbi:hypothetical protein B5X24_HaOG207817 [Helicoverpa armigera]|nr:hypothetical protein B5X24_HaOG207817 [Helicoverpa armigera]
MEGTRMCGACDEAMSDGVSCTVCGRELHFQCAGITEAGYRKLGDRRLIWRCMNCKLTGTVRPPGVPAVTVNPLSSPKSPIGLDPELPRLGSESVVLQEIRALAAKLTPLEGLKEEISALRTEFVELKSSIHQQFEETVNEFRHKIIEMEQRIVVMETIKEQVNQLHGRLDKLEEESDTKDQWSRLNNVEIKGLPQVNNENLFEVIAKIRAKINYPITKTQINFVTRVPARDKDRTKPIIVSFLSRYMKEDFVAAARYVLKTSPITASQFGLSGNQRIFINDHLTVKNKILLSKTKKMAAEMGFQYVWVKHAKIYARKMDTSPVLSVKSEKDLTKIV